MNRLEDRIKYYFKDSNLLEIALTHSSYASEKGEPYEKNNERFEFLGDAYLDAIIGHYLLDMMPHAEEGILSKLRAAIVCEDSLATVARTIELGGNIRLGRGESLNGGRDKDSILADALEALIGAIIEDGGFEAGRTVVLNLMDGMIRLALDGKLHHDYKSALQEKVQAIHKGNTEIKYNLVNQSGPAHDRVFEVEVTVNGKMLGKGTGKSKRQAEQQAARTAITEGNIGAI